MMDIKRLPCDLSLNLNELNGRVRKLLLFKENEIIQAL